MRLPDFPSDQAESARVRNRRRTLDQELKVALSVNEELQTVNAELSGKNDRLMRANRDLQNFLDSTEIATVFLDADLGVKSFTPATTALFDLRESDRGRPLDEIVSRLAYGNLRADIEDALRDLRTVERELSLANHTGTYIMRIRPYRMLDDAVEGVVITFVDISGRRRVEEILREHAAIVQFSQDALVGLTPDGVIRSWNPAAERLLGRSAAETVGQPIDLLGSPDLQQAGSALLQQALTGAAVGPVETTARRGDGTRLDLEVALAPIEGTMGTISGLALSARDIGERKRADEHRALLVGELSHRVKNTLANVKAIAFQTRQTSLTSEAFEDSFSGRLMALAKTHDLLTGQQWQGAMLRDVIEAELRPYEAEAGVRSRCEGPEVSVSAKAALALGMAFHELATNATKYGALSVAGGRVDVTWSRQTVGSEDRICITWVESGGPAVKESGRRGFGTRLVSDSLADELDGDVTLAFDPAGVRCIIDFPLEGYSPAKA